MIRTMLAAALATIIVGTINVVQSRHEITPNDHRAARAATLPIMCWDRTCGTAVQIAPGLFVTAAHIPKAAAVNRPARFEHPDQPVAMLAVKKNGRKYPALVEFKTDRFKDIAILRSTTSCPCVALAENSPPVDSPAFTAGFPFAFTAPVLTTTRAIITEGAIQDKVEPTSLGSSSMVPLAAYAYVTSIYINRGSSGGGLFIKENGSLRVVGIASRGATVPERARGMTPVLVTRYYHQYGLFGTLPSIRYALMEAGYERYAR